MAAALTPEQVDGWAAFDAVEPLGMRGLASQLAEFLAMFAASRGVEDVNSKRFLPGVQVDIDAEQTPEEQRAAARRASGVQ